MLLRQVTATLAAFWRRKPTGRTARQPEQSEGLDG